MDEPEWQVWSEPVQKFVATVRCGSGIDEEANASLIAAAPDLLEALKQIHDRALHSAACGDAKCGCHAALRAVKAANAKAEGR